MNKDLEKAIKAAQCAALLCDDLLALVSTDNLVLSDVAMNNLCNAQNLKANLDHLASNLKKMDEVARRPHLVSAAEG